ncbi:uncharacterized protein DUF4238 [Rhizobium sp. PP-F2F-G38]|nr:uncharacterized protein DUF4238 [Rhizobium sp. PP-F2F-G38]
MSEIEAKRHHYVPQLYLRQFACADDPNKVMVLENHLDIVVWDRKSIDRIGYDEGLYDYEEDGARSSIEGELNRHVETPFAASPTWAKISTGACGSLEETDRVPLYGFARHLQKRNLETLRFIERQNARYQAGELEAELTDDERDMHSWIAAFPNAAHELFRTGAMDIMPPADASAINVMICHSPVALRASTNPTIVFSQPAHQSIFGRMFDGLRIWWLPLDRHCGAMIVAGGPSGFSHQSVSADVVRLANQRYLIQLLQADARYLIADDDFLSADLNWAGFSFEQKTTRGFRYRSNRS